MEDRHMILNLSSTSCGSSSASFLGVYDGHNGDSIAEKLRRSLHQHLVADPAYPTNISTALRGAFATFDRMLLGGSSDSGTEDAGTGIGTGQNGSSQTAKMAGSTALVVVPSGCHLHVANLGDCRAVVARQDASFGSVDASSGDAWPVGALVEVRESANADLKGQRGVVVEIRSATKHIYVIRLLRDGMLRPLRRGSLRLLSELKAVRLTQDHKPDADSERTRIEALGGVIEVSQRGTARVAGLATSRSFGSLSAQPFLSAEPDVLEVALMPKQDVFMVMASDGVWDVLDDQLVVDLIWDQVSSVPDSRRGPAAAIADAAQLVVQTALDRGALDNLTCAILLMKWAACSGAACPATWTS